MGSDIGLACRGTNPFIHFLALLFGMGSDLAVAGIWVELPILVFFLPEGWSLGSYMTIVLQAANIAPMVYTIGHLFAPKFVRERPTIYFIAFLGSTASLLLAFFWDRTSVIFGSLHSTALFSLHFCLSIMDCTSSIVFITAMGVFNDSYMTTFFLGEGLSGLVPALVALAQGAGEVTCSNSNETIEVEINGTLQNVTESVTEPILKEPNFSVLFFFVCLCSMQIISIIAYSLLMYLPLCKKEHIRNKIELEIELEITAENGDKPPPGMRRLSKTYEKEVPLNVKAIKYSSMAENELIAHPLVALSHGRETSLRLHDKEKDGDELEGGLRTKLNPFQYALMLFITAWSTFLANGFLLAIQSYSSLPYGSEPYHQAVILATISNPVSCVLASFLPIKSKRIVVGLSVLGTLISAYILTLALQSPEPVLVNTTAGSALVVTAWVLVVFILTYCRVCAALVLKLHGSQGLFWYGFMTQAGSAVGAVFSFLMVNVFDLFQDASSCPTA